MLLNFDHQSSHLGTIMMIISLRLGIPVIFKLKFLRSPGLVELILYQLMWYNSLCTFDGISGIKSLLDHKYRTLIEDKFISF